MSFVLKNSSDNTIIHESLTSEKDFYQISNDWMHLKHEHGEMKMIQWMFDGVRIVISDSVFTEPVSLDWQGNLEVITMYFSLKGSLFIESDPANRFELGNYQQNMFYGREASGFMKAPGLQIQSFMIQFDKNAFLRIAEGGTDSLKYFASQVSNNKTASFSKEPLPIDINTQIAINAVTNCKFNDSLKRVFFLSKAMELLVLQADLHAQSMIKKTTCLRTDYDRERIHFARDYMTQHIDEPPTISELAKIVGINEFKLKKGYKEIFGNTIFGHLADLRMELSKASLCEGKKTVSEIAFDLGYSSVQHFSAAFKKKYGIRPTDLKPLV